MRPPTSASSPTKAPALDGMIVDEGVIVEIVRPGTGDPVPAGEVGEVVVTTFNRDYPMIRFATGDLSAVLPGASPCGRTNMRIKGWLGRADQTTKVKGMFVHPEHVAEIARRHAGLGRLRLVVGRAGEQDTMTLRAEARQCDARSSQAGGNAASDHQAARARSSSSPPARCPTTARSSPTSALIRTSLGRATLRTWGCPPPGRAAACAASAPDGGLLDGLHRHRLGSVAIPKGCGLDLFELDPPSSSPASFQAQPLGVVALELRDHFFGKQLKRGSRMPVHVCRPGRAGS